MGRKLVRDEMHWLVLDAKKAVDRVKWTAEDRLWFKKACEIVSRRAFVEPVGGARTRASLTPNTAERRLLVKAWRRALPLSASEAMKAAEGTGPLSLTLAEWTVIRADLIRSFYGPVSRRKERQLERLIARVEDLITSALQPDHREKDSPPSDSGPRYTDAGVAPAVARDG